MIQGLFSQGIGQSGSALSPWAFDEEPEYSARQIAANAGIERVFFTLICRPCLGPHFMQAVSKKM